MCRLTKYEEEHEGFYPVAFESYEEWSEFLDSIDVVDCVNIATCIDELGEYEDKEERNEVKVIEEEEIAPYCPNCGSGEYLHNEDGNRNDYCGQCGVELDWSGVKDNYDLEKYGFVPKVKITEEDKKIGNVTFKKGVHIYFCGHCNQGILPSWKHCAHCGEKIVWKDKRNLKQ